MIYKWKLILCPLLAVILLSGCSDPPTNQPTQQSQSQSQNDVTSLNWKVPKFSATDQAGKQVTLQSLHGKVWLTHFLFTRCPDICPPMTANLARVQRALQKAGIPATFVSFTVNPEFDTPQVLKKFALEHGANLSNWHFLTGYTFQTVQQIGLTAFKGQIKKVASSDPNIVLYNHPSQFYLVDQTGKVRKFYDGLRPNIKQIVQDVKTIDQENH